MSKMRLLLAAALISCLSTATVRVAESGGPAAPQVNLDLLRDTIRANRKALIAVNLALTDEEAAKFWPLYERYQTEISTVGDRVAALVEDYITHFRDLSNEKALQLTGTTSPPRPTASRCDAPTSASSPRSCRAARSRDSIRSRTRWTRSCVTIWQAPSPWSSRRAARPGSERRRTLRPLASGPARKGAARVRAGLGQRPALTQLRRFPRHRRR